MTQSTVEFSKTNAIEITKASPVRVLHVDDDAGFLKTAKAILEMQGAFQIDTASSVEEAWEKMKKEEYDVVVSDYQMPGKDGLQFLKELREKGDSIPFVIFTGRGREEVAIKALNLGADGYFNKIGEPETVYGELEHSIKKTVKARRAEEALRKSEENLRSLLNSMDDLVFVINLDGTFEKYYQPSHLDDLYVPPSEFVGKHSKDILPPDVAESLEEAMKKVETTGETQGFDYSLEMKGRKSWYNARISPIRDQLGNITSFTGVVRNVTERKKNR